MSNEFKLLSVEPTQEMLDAITTERKKGNGALQCWYAAFGAAPQPPALGGELVSLIIRDLCETVPAFGTDAVHLRVSELEAILQAHLAPLQTEIERLTAENTALRAAGEVCVGAIPHLDSARQERDQLKADLAERWEQIAELNSEAVQLKARNDEQNRLLNEFHEVTIGGFLDSDHVLRLRRDLEALLSKPAGSEQA